MPIVLCLVATPMSAASSTGKPVFHKYAYSDYSMLSVLSDNGEWGLAQAAYSDDAASGLVKLVNISSGDVTYIQTQSEVTANGAFMVSDVTNDGNIVVGEYLGQAAYWTASTGEFTYLPTPDGWGGAYVSAVTPDGKYAVGGASGADNIWTYTAAMWNLETGELLEFNNLPSLDMQHEESDMLEFCSVSADGRYATGRLAWSYLYPPQLCAFVFDTQLDTCIFIGYDASDTDDWEPWDDELYFVAEAMISPSGQYVTGTAYIEDDTGGYYTSYLYDLVNDKFEVYTESDDQDVGATCVDNDGNVYASSPWQTTPIREWYVRHGDYWYGFRDILEQAYGIDYETYTGYDNSGTPMSVSADGTSVAVMVDPSDGGSYVVELPENLSTICDSINLLGSYSVTPAEESAMAYMYVVSIVFDRNIELADGTTYKSASLLDSVGNVVRNVMASGGIQISSSSSKTLLLTFRTTALDEDAQYTVHIDEGAIQIVGDDTKQNEAIDLVYYGRAAEPVEITNVYPAEGSELAKIDASYSQVIFTFDANVALTDDPTATLYRTTDGEEVEVCSLSFLVEDNRIATVPTSTQYLYQGETYKVVLGAGSVTDLSTVNASTNTANATSNEEMTVNYIGTYEREISGNDTTLFSDDFSDGSQSYADWIRYEGDGNTPTSAMQAMTFDADNYPWLFYIRENEESDDWCAGSHSMYDPAGKSDDWMMIPQLAIPDEFCTLKFDAQSYLEAKYDTLKIIIWASEESISELTAARTATIREEGDLVFCERLYPGSSEEDLADDWVTYYVDLSQYSGQSIYICFINENEDQSMVLVDNVVVYRNLKYILSLSNASSVVNQESITIRGTLTANSEEDTFTSVALALINSDGDTISTVSDSGLALAKGDTYSFTFAEALPLTVGEKNTFSIGLQLDDYSDLVSSTIKDLAFEPTKRVVVEEMTGTTCQNCPLGILAIENLEEIYGEQFIPISIHTYTGDQLASGMSGYTSYLGLSAAPSGLVNRSGDISYPMATDPETGDYVFSLDGELWLDLVMEEMETPADFDVDATVTVDDDGATFATDITICSAMKNTSLNLNFLIVLLEDSVISYQYNDLYNTVDDNLGEWGYGGIYASSVVYNYPHMDVCRYAYGDTWAGASGYFPQSMAAGEESTVSITDLSVPGTIDDIDRAKMVVLIIDANTDKIANAVSVNFPGYTTGISSVRSVKETWNGIAADADGKYNVYSVSGMRVMSTEDGSQINGLPTGLYIVNGKKIVVK